MKSYSIFQKHKAKGNKTWYGRISEDGLFHVISLRTKKKADAEAWRDMMNAKKFLPETEEAPNVKFTELVNKFLDYAEHSKGLSSLSVYAYVHRTNLFLEFTKKINVHTFNDFTELNAVNFANEISAKFAPKTAQGVIKLIKAMFDFSCRVYHTSDNPFKFVRAPKLKKSAKGFWTPEEINKILSFAPNPEYRRFWALMAFAGLRYFEARDAVWGNIQGDNLVIHGKGDKTASVPISERLRMELGTIGKSSERIVPEGTFATHLASLRVLRQAVESAGLNAEDANNHRFRHSFASNLLRSGVNVKAVQRLMRHESAEITLNTYSHLITEDLKKAVDVI